MVSKLIPSFYWLLFFNLLLPCASLLNLGKKLTKGFYRCFADADQGSYDMFEIAEDAEEQQEILHELGDLQSFFFGVES